MSSDKSLEQQFLEFELPKEVLDYLTRLKCLNESQEKELNSIRQKNERLEQKLKNIQAYNEELQEQVLSNNNISLSAKTKKIWTKVPSKECNEFKKSSLVL